MACAACREGRRRCNGAPLGCGRCARIGRICVYDRPVVAHPHAPAAAFPLVVAPSLSGDSGARVLRLTEEERGELRAVFDFTNRIFEAGVPRYELSGVPYSTQYCSYDAFLAVDEASFFAALDAPKYVPSSEPACPLALRACCAVLLSIGARLRRRAVPAKAYYDEAIRCGALTRALRGVPES